MVMGCVSYCPHADQCNRGGKRLGWDEDEEKARERIWKHLVNSSHHHFSEEDAKAAAETAEMEAEEWDPPKPKHGSKGAAARVAGTMQLGSKTVPGSLDQGHIRWQ